jgi:hypothetical protein
MAHSRALYVFFTTPIDGRYKDDVLAEDYGFGAMPIYSEDSKQRFFDRYNKDLLHIIYTRLKRVGSEKPWNISEMLPPVIERCKQFIPHVIALSWGTILEGERDKWGKLIPNHAAGVPLQQHTSNVAAQQIKMIRIRARDA